MNNFTLRTITGAAFVILIIGSVLVNHWVFGILFLAIAVGGYWEFCKIARQMNSYPHRLWGTILSIYTFCIITGWHYNIFLDYILYLLLLVPPTLLVVELFRKTSTAIANVSMAFFGIVWIVVPLSLLTGFFNFEEEHKWRQTGALLGFFLILWIYDSGAYVFGSMLGKHKMLERVSPKKSWEGFAGGTLIGFLIAYIISASFTEFSVLEWLVIAVLIIIFGTFGDLTESMIKRNAGIKDSGKLLPGHGGILDRFDAVLLAAPIVYIFLRLLRDLN